MSTCESIKIFQDEIRTDRNFAGLNRAKEARHRSRIGVLFRTMLTLESASAIVA